MTIQEFDPAAEYEFTPEAFPFIAAEKVPATLDAEDVTGNLPIDSTGLATEAKQDEISTEVVKIPRQGFTHRGTNVTPDGDYTGQTELHAISEVTETSP